MGKSISVTPRSREDIRMLTYNLRKIFKLEDVLYFPIVEFLELILPQLDPEFQFVVLSVSEMQDRHGNTIPNEHKIEIREDVYNGAIAGNGRDRGTIAHEIGHYLCHSKGISLARSDVEVKVFCDPEWQAKAFAGELLVPAHLVKEMTVEDVAYKCGVSKASAAYQLSKQKNR